MILSNFLIIALYFVAKMSLKIPNNEQMCFRFIFYVHT